jgi:hypothetical protein
MACWLRFVCASNDPQDTHLLIHPRNLSSPSAPPAESSRIRQASWECLSCIASGYYDKLPAYMQDIFSLTQQAVGRDEEEVVLQALEFWCTVAEEETDREGVSSGKCVRSVGAEGGGQRVSSRRPSGSWLRWRRMRRAAG